MRGNELSPFVTTRPYFNFFPQYNNWNLSVANYSSVSEDIHENLGACSLKNSPPTRLGLRTSSLPAMNTSAL